MGKRKSAVRGKRAKNRLVEIRLKGPAAEIRRVLVGRADLADPVTAAPSSRLLSPVMRPQAHFDEFTFANSHPNEPVTNIVYRLYPLDPAGGGYVLPEPAMANPERGYCHWHEDNELGAVTIKVEFTLESGPAVWTWGLPFGNFAPYDSTMGQGWWINEVNVGFAFNGKRVAFAFIRLANAQWETLIVTAGDFPHG